MQALSFVASSTEKHFVPELVYKMFGAIEDKHNLRSSDTSKLFPYLVFIAVIAEKLESIDMS